MTKEQRAQASREKILAAAESVILEKGVANLTLDAVAASAGVSKGGLLYHFAAKEALIVALVEKIVASIEVDLQRAYDAEPEGPGRAIRAMIAESQCRTANDLAERERLGAALLGAAGSNPELLAPLRHAFSEWMSRIDEDGLAPGVPLVIAAALDGLAFWTLFGLYSPSPAALSEASTLLKKLASTTK
jgi:AcrR family transcriptional regulator